MKASVPPAIRWLFEDRRTERLVVGQAPNLLMLAFVAASASRLADSRKSMV